MSKKWVHGGFTPEGTSYAIEVNVPKLKKKKDGVPEPPPNFTPGQEAITSDQNHPPILTGAQGYAQARENKEN